MLRKILGIVVLVFWASNAYSLVDVEALYGKRWYETKDAAGNDLHTSGNAYTVGINFDPIPLVPVSFGAYYTQVDLHKKDFKADKAQITEFGIDVKAWLSLFPFVTPYVRASYVAASKLKITYDNFPAANTDTNLSGYRLAVGIERKILPFIALLLEVDQAFEKAHSFAGQKQDFNSRGFSIGLSVGI